MPNSAKTKSAATVAITVVAYAIFLCIVGNACYQRITEANKLTGSTALEIDSQINAIYNPVGENGESSSTTEGSNYVYIDEQKLSSMDASELAAWYLTQFPDTEHINSSELEEFNTWYEEKSSKDATFASEYTEALEALKEAAANPPEIEIPTVEDENESEKSEAEAENEDITSSDSEAEEMPADSEYGDGEMDEASDTAEGDTSTTESDVIAE
jgi:hypothetical protein